MTESTVTDKRKPGRPKAVKEPPVPITETPEFKDAVTAAATKAAAEILASLKASQGGEIKQGDAGFAEGLALAIAQLSSQGTGRAKPVAPEIIKARSDAQALMTELIVAARARGDVPTYHLRNKVYLAETLIDPVVVEKGVQIPTQIEWMSVPNEAMVPTNDVAKAIYEAFSNSIGVVQIDKTKFIKPEHYAVTGKGLVIRGGSLATQPLQVDPNNVDGLRVMGPDGAPKSKTINVLGTVAPPARVGGP